MSTDSAMWDKGLKLRREVLGAEYVDKSVANANDFTQAFQEITTEWCWGYAWSRPGLDKKTRSMLNLVMLAALGKMHEWEIHCHGAINNGVSKEEIRSIIHIVGIYCGVPQSLECFRHARKVLEERGLSSASGN